MNVILTYKQTSDFTEDAQKEINKLQFSFIPEMRIIEETIDEVVYKIMPYQANVSEDKFEYFKSLLEQFGVVDIIGKWNDDGSKIELDINKYRDALNDIVVYERAVFYDGVDYTGIEDTYVYLQDEEGNDIQPSITTFKRLKFSKRPTLTQAKQTQVNVFNNQFVRELV